MKYVPLGPVIIPKTNQGSIDGAGFGRRGQFWDQVDEANGNISTAKGIYIFGAKTGTNCRPWYVGKANGWRGYKGEVFTPHKLYLYNKVIMEKYQNAFTPVLFLLVRRTPADRISRKVKNKEIEFVEKMIIGRALERNPELMNKSDTKYLTDLVVEGITDAPRGGHYPQDTQSMRLMLGL